MHFDLKHLIQSASHLVDMKGKSEAGLDKFAPANDHFLS